MAHFAEIDQNNIVKRVIVVDDAQQHRGQDYIANDLMFGGRWVQTSYNTFGGKHIKGGTPIGYNYAGIGFIYYPEYNGFSSPKPFYSWVLDTDTLCWQSPVPYPTDGEDYTWNECISAWMLTSQFVTLSALSGLLTLSACG